MKLSGKGRLIDIYRTIADFETLPIFPLSSRKRGIQLKEAKKQINAIKQLSIWAYYNLRRVLDESFYI